MGQEEMEKEELAIKALEFYHKITEEVDSKGYYRVTDPNEIIVPIDGLIIRCGKRRVVRFLMGLLL